MQIVIGLGISAAIVLGVWLLSDFQRKRQMRRTRARLLAEWGRPRTQVASDGIGVYHFHQSNQSGDSLDNTTWADLRCPKGGVETGADGRRDVPPGGGSTRRARRAAADWAGPT